MPDIRVADDEIAVGKWFSVSFQRTLRIPDDGRVYPLPPGLGRFPVAEVNAYATGAPPAWHDRGGYFIPMYQREAMWLAFGGADWHPCAVQIGIGGVNAVSGGAWSDGLSDSPQNYLVCPEQPWLDGINAGAGTIRQFIAMPLGQGYTVEGQLTGKEDTGGIHFRVYQARPGRFPDRAPRRRPEVLGIRAMSAAQPMGLGAGGQMRQKIYPDRHGLDTWNTEEPVSVSIHIVNSQDYQSITGRPPPATPIDAAAYTRHGLPWFDLYDEHLGALAASAPLAGVKSVQQIDAETGAQAGEGPVDIQPGQVKKLDL